MSDDPVRLLDARDVNAPSDGGFLRAALEAGRADLPDAAALEALATKLGPLLAGGPPPGAPPPAAPPIAGAAPIAGGGATAVKAIAAIATAIALLAGGALYVGRGHDATPLRPPPPSAIAVTSTQAPEIPRAADTATAIAAVASVVPEPSSAKPGATSAAPSAKSPEIESPVVEVRLLQRAQDALRSSPDEALTLCAEHARRYPHGVLAQEREVIAIDALASLHRGDEANARAEKFRTEWPTSSHLRRIDALLQKSAAPRF